MKKKLIPADTVDTDGKVWETVGENIRNGAKEIFISEDFVKEIVNVLFPVGSVYCGENSFILSVGQWTQLIDNAGESLILGTTGVTGSVAAKRDPNFADTYTDHPVIRMFKRIS